jgi:hypothetical protein
MRPYGVWAVISPFNFPMALSAEPMGAALVAGNTVVLKPSELFLELGSGLTASLVTVHREVMVLAEPPACDLDAAVVRGVQLLVVRRQGGVGDAEGHGSRSSEGPAR